MAIDDDEQRLTLARWLDDEGPVLEGRVAGDAFRTYPRLKLAGESAPWAPFTKELAAARIALVTSAGLYSEGDQAPFDAANPYGDYTYRLLSLSAPVDRLRIAHDHYDHTAAVEDINVVYPIDRLQELVRDGVIGEVIDTVVSFMGYQPDWRPVRDRLGPDLAAVIAAQQADAVLLVPV